MIISNLEKDTFSGRLTFAVAKLYIFVMADLSVFDQINLYFRQLIGASINISSSQLLS